MFEQCHQCIPSVRVKVRESDDVYQLNASERHQICVAASEWVQKHGEYSSHIHCSLQQTDDHRLCAAQYIFQYEVLGRFVGDEMLESEFHDIYAGCFDEYKRSLWSWVLSVSNVDMLLDVKGKNGTSPTPLLLIEDCRGDPGKEVTTNEDLRKENVLFVTIEVNGWPAKFAIAKRGIAKDESLYGHFGEGYSSLRDHAHRQRESVKQYMAGIERILL